MPAIGLGTFGSDRFSGEDIAKAVIGAAEVGYRHFDCAGVRQRAPTSGLRSKRSWPAGFRAKSCG
jgi:alcohol dehydrogenase (NADP+)